MAHVIPLSGRFLLLMSHRGCLTVVTISVINEGAAVLLSHSHLWLAL